MRIKGDRDAPKFRAVHKGVHRFALVMSNYRFRFIWKSENLPR